jgi:hypothetical protein
MGGSIEDVRPDSLDAALEVAIQTLNNVLFYCFVTMLASLALIGFLLKRCR